MGTTGFARAKGQPGFLPVGNLFVIPKDYESFLEKVEMKLYVNNHLRQSETANNMRAKPKDILKRIFDNNSLSFYSLEQSIDLLANNEIPQGTIILSGTPAGVIFRIANVLNPMVYLQEGDKVTLKADYLGVVVNEIM
jgi:2-keto-4-pentenoate hydratase/2-oxohepta-3-ene-1,7-dioic acid hydratase in catechol pathway